jgi:HlyD family secretion protein
MSNKKWYSLLLIFLLVLLVTGCNAASAAPEQQVSAPERPPVPVEVTKAETGNVAATLSYSGDLQPVHSLSLVSIVSGAIEEVMVEVGDEVRAGDPIIRVEDTTYRAQLKQVEAGLTSAQANLMKMERGPRQEQIEMAEAGLEAARAQLEGITTMTEDERTVAAANLAQAEAALRLAQYEYDKIKWAGQTSQTPQALQLQQATIGYETALAAYNLQANPDKSTLTQLRAAIRQAELNLQLARDPFVPEDFTLARAGVVRAEGAVALAQYQVDNSILRAPFDGLVSEVYVTTGGVASPQSPAIQLISKDLEVLVDVPENQIAKLYKNQPAALKVAAHPGKDFPALITSIAPIADTTSHTFPIKVTPVDADSELRGGMFADVTILLEEKVGVVLVPVSAVTVIDDQEVVFIVSDDEKTVTLRPVTTGLSDIDRVEIVEGLAPGEPIVMAGLSNLSDGAAIEVVARTE